MIEEGYFGDPRASLEQLLEYAYSDFLLWAKNNGITHSQRKFHPNFVIKKATGAYMTSKGWNSRLLLNWLADCSMRAFRKTLQNRARVFGQWLAEHGREAPDTVFLAPQALALQLAFPLRLFPSLFVSTLVDRSLIEISMVQAIYVPVLWAL